MSARRKPPSEVERLRRDLEDARSVALSFASPACLPVAPIKCGSYKPLPWQGLSAFEFYEETVNAAVEEARRMELSAADTAAFCTEVGGKADEYAKLARAKASHGGKALARLTAAQAKELVDSVKREWSGAPRARHFATASAKYLVKVLKKALAGLFEETAWDSYLKASDPERHYVLDSGANLFIDIAFVDGNVTVKVRVLGAEGDGNAAEQAADALTYSMTKSLAMILVDSRKYSEIRKALESMIEECVRQVKVRLAVLTKK